MMSSEKRGNEPPPDYNQTGYPAQPAGAYPQPPAGGYPPQQGGGYPPQQGGGYPPQQGGGYPPQQGGGYGQQPGGPYAQYGQQNQAVIVTQPMGVQYVVGAARPPDYTIPSFIACFFFFWPTGLFAIYYSMRSTTLARDGDMAGAQQMSTSARNCMIASFIIGAFWIIAVIVARVVIASTATYSYNY